MAKPKIKTNDWILIVFLKTASEDYGINIGDIYNYRKIPDEFKSDTENFFRVIEKMEADGLIMKAPLDKNNYCLSTAGKKKALELEAKMTYEDYYSLISKFPEIEFRERIEVLENFILLSIALIGLYFKGPLIIQWMEQKVPFSGGTTFILVLSYLSIQYIEYSGRLFFFWILRVKKGTLWKLGDWIWNNRNTLYYPMLIIIMGGVLYEANRLQILTIQSAIGSLILYGITKVIENHKKIKSRIENMKRV